MGKILALETHFDGHHFRSRAEARWAVFLRELDIPYDYEPDGYSLDSGPYLPDFRLSEIGVFLEVKGDKPSAPEMARAHDLAILTKMPVLVAVGPPKPSLGHALPHGSMIACFPSGAEDEDYWWCECPVCGLVGPQYSGRADRLPCDHCDRETTFGYDSTRLLGAYDAARQARFGT